MHAFFDQTAGRSAIKRNDVAHRLRRRADTGRREHKNRQ